MGERRSDYEAISEAIRKVERGMGDFVLKASPAPGALRSLHILGRARAILASVALLRRSSEEGDSDEVPLLAAFLEDDLCGVRRLAADSELGEELQDLLSDSLSGSRFLLEALGCGEAQSEGSPPPSRGHPLERERASFEARLAEERLAAEERLGEERAEAEAALDKAVRRELAMAERRHTEERARFKIRLEDSLRAAREESDRRLASERAELGRRRVGSAPRPRRPESPRRRTGPRFKSPPRSSTPPSDSD